MLGSYWSVRSNLMLIAKLSSVHMMDAVQHLAIDAAAPLDETSKNLCATMKYGSQNIDV